MKRYQEDLRGQGLQVSEGLIDFIVTTADEYLSKQKRKKRLKIGSFMKWLNKVYRERMEFFGSGKSRRVITEILVANGLYEERVSKKKYPGYKPRLTRYCPNAQLVGDGKKLDIEFMGEKFQFNLEMVKDMLSEAITGHTLSEEEDAEAVLEVLEQHSSRYGKPLSILLDNAKANYKAVSQELEDVIPIFAFKGNPETKAIIEGEFSNLEREMGPIRIEGEEKRDLARGILKSMIDLYVKFRNQKPRCSVCTRTPLKLMEQGAGPQELQQAKEGLQERQKRSLAMKEEPGQRSEMLALIEDIMTRSGLLVDDKDRFIKTMLKYDEKAIRQAEADFFALSQHDSFSETKRNGQYFVGIVRNKQIALDLERKKELYSQRYSLDQQWQEKRKSEQKKQEERKEEDTARKYPEKVLLDSLTIALNLKRTIGFQSGFFMNKIRETLEVLLKKHNLKERIATLADDIMAITDWTMEKRLELITKVRAWVAQASVQGVGSVTLEI